MTERRAIVSPVDHGFRKPDTVRHVVITPFPDGSTLLIDGRETCWYA